MPSITQPPAKSRFRATSVTHFNLTRHWCSPGEVEERGGFAGEGGGDGDGAGGDVEPGGRGEGLELAGGLELGVLLGGGVLGRAHRNPHGVGVGVGIVDAEVLEQDLAYAGGDAGDFDGDLGGGDGEIFVVVVPEHDRGFVGGLGGEGVYIKSGAGVSLHAAGAVGLVADAGFGDVVGRDGGGAGGGDAITGEEAGHAEDVEDGLVDAVGGEGAEAFEVLLAFELEGPGDHADEVDLVLGGEIGERFHGGGGVGGVDRAVAVGVVRVLPGGAGGAAFRVGFREDDGQAVVFGGGGYGAKAVGGGADLVLQTHADVGRLAGTGRNEARVAFGMEGDEVERNGIAGPGVLVVGAVVQEAGEEGDGALAAGAGAAGAADASVGQRLADTGDGVVVELQVIGGRALPVGDVGLVPDLEVPGGDFIAAIALDEVLDDAAHQFAPHGVVLGRALHGALDGVGVRHLVR